MSYFYFQTTLGSKNGARLGEPCKRASGALFDRCASRVYKLGERMRQSDRWVVVTRFCVVE